MSKNFRQCAGAVVFNKDGKVLLGNRNDVSGNNWQFPQGGIEQNESPIEAARRELFEETSIHSVEIVAAADTPYRYEFTDEIKQNFKKRGIFSDGQDIYFTLFFFNGREEEINVCTAQPEFKEYQWQTIEFAIDNIVSFKRKVYLNMAEQFAPLIKHYLCKSS